jgi:ATP-dependent DNA helicase RecQ
VIKSAANKSALKVSIIQNIDRQLALEDIASAKGLSYADILNEIDMIVNSGTKLNLNYYIDEMIDTFALLLERQNLKLYHSKIRVT